MRLVSINSTSYKGSGFHKKTGDTTMTTTLFPLIPLPIKEAVSQPIQSQEQCTIYPVSINSTSYKGSGLVW